MKISRRSVLAWAAAPAAVLAQKPTPLTVGGDYVKQFEGWLTREAAKHWDRRDQQVASLDRAGLKARQEYVKRTMLELIGGLPTEKTPLNAKVTGGFQRDGYRVENVIFESLPGFRVTANLYLPTSGKGPFPAVLGVAGHSNNGKASSTYQHAFIGFAKRGFAVLAFDPPGQGERLEYFDSTISRSLVGVGVPEHNMAGLQCLLTGHTFARYEIWDGIRAFDYLLTRQEVDPKRIAVAGNSGGGTQAAYLAVFEPRLAAVVSSCYMTRWRELWSGPGPQDAEQIFPRFIEKELDFGDFMFAQAPRPYLMTTAIRDFFPIDGARATFKQTQRVFDLLGGGEKAGFFEYDDTHGWSQPRREAAYRWLEHWLKKNETDGKEPSIQTEEESLLYATSSGQLATSAKSETVQSLNKKEAQKLTAKRSGLTVDALAQAIDLRRDTKAPEVNVVGTETRNQARVEKLELTVEGGVRIPALFFIPSNLASSRRVVLFVSSFGKNDPDIAELMGSGTAVLALDPRGVGESYSPPARTGYSQAYQLSARAMLIGRNLVEMQVADLLSAARYLSSRPEAKGKDLTLFAKGASGPSALMTAAMMPEIKELVIESSIISYQSVVDAGVHRDLERTVVPGILKHLDLLDVVGLLGGRKLMLVSPARPNGTPMLTKEAEAVLGTKRSSVEIVARGENWPLNRVVSNWFK